MDTLAIRIRLREALLEYRERRPNLSLRAIARNSGVNRYFLNKLLEEPKAGDNSPFDLNQVLLFLKFVTKKNTIRDIMESSSEEVKELLSSVFHPANQDRVLRDSTNNLNLYDFYTYFIMHLAAFNNGIKRPYIEKILGNSAFKTLNSLLDKRVLKEENGRIYVVEDQDFTYAPDVTRHHFGNYSRFFDPEHIGQNRNFISVSAQGVNREGLQKLQEIYIDAYKKTDSLLRNPKNWGDIPAFAISCVDTFIDDINENEEV